MKTILVPTDFSEISKNAIDYAAEIAKLTKAKLILFHVYMVPVVPAEAPILMPTEEIEKNAVVELKKIEKKIHLKYGDSITTEVQCKWGFALEEINLSAEANKVDLIVMGMEGAGYLTENLIGSLTTSLIKKSKCPVLAIDKNIKFKSIKQIALACDYTETKNKLVLAPLKEFAELFKSHIYVFNVVANELETVPTISKAVEGIKLTHLLEGTQHSFHYTKNENIVEGINGFVDENKIDMLVMIPRVHTALHNLFNEPKTKKMAFHTKVPLLTLHE